MEVRAEKIRAKKLKNAAGRQPRLAARRAAVTVLAFSVALISCRHKSSAAEVIRRMQARACAGDVAGFLAHIDREALLHFAIDTSRARDPRAPFRPPGNVADPNAPVSESETRKQVDRLVLGWTEDIRGANESTLCRMQVIEPSNTEAFLVDVAMPTGKRTWLLSLLKDRWVVVGLRDER
jgi:hypothetical protein